MMRRMFYFYIFLECILILKISEPREEERIWGKSMCIVKLTDLSEIQSIYIQQTHDRFITETSF